MTHVLSIIHYPVFGGPHNRNMRLAPILARQGIKTTVLLPDEPGNAIGRLRGAGVEVVQLPLQRIRATYNMNTNLRFLWSLRTSTVAIRNLMAQLQIDLIQINGLANPHGALAAHGAGIPVVWQILDTYTPMSLRRIFKPLLARYADVIMCTGKRVAALHPGAEDRTNRLVTFFPPVDLEYYSPNPDTRAAVRREFEIPESSLVIGTVGNINRQKGHDNFIRAAAHLKSKLPEAKFMILGTTHQNHKGYIDELWKLAGSLGLRLGKDLLVLDPAGRLHELAQSFDVYWMTPRLRSEGIPTTMEEAMALSLPVVSFDVGSISELVEHGRTGYLVYDQNPKSIADYTIGHLLDSNKRAAMGRLGRRFVATNASLDECAARHLAAYSLALGERDSAPMLSLPTGTQ